MWPSTSGPAWQLSNEASRWAFERARKGAMIPMPAIGARTVMAVSLAYYPIICAVRFAYRKLRQRSSEEDESPTTLDPADWTVLRAEAHKLLDASLDKMESAKEGRVWTPVPPDVKTELLQPLPEHGLTHDAVSQRLQNLLPYSSGNTHPRFFGWVHGAGNPGGVLAELVASAMNANCGGRDHAHLYVERQVLAWCRTMMGFPADSGGLLVSGTSMATILALKAARDAALGFVPSRQGGVASGQQRTGRLVGYAAEGTHSCVKRAFDVLGLGSDALRLVPVGADFTMDVAELRRLIEADRHAGARPWLVVGTAGSVNVGAIDPLDAIAALCKAHGLWFHIDGAFGAAAVLSSAAAALTGLERVRGHAYNRHPSTQRADPPTPPADPPAGRPSRRHRLAPQADSLAFDFHKWFHVNYDAGCVLIRSHDAHIRSFSDRPDYLAGSDRGLAAGSPWPVDYGLELSRGFRALKVRARACARHRPGLHSPPTHGLLRASYMATGVGALPRARHRKARPVHHRQPAAREAPRTPRRRLACSRAPRAAEAADRRLPLLRRPARRGGTRRAQRRDCRDVAGARHRGALDDEDQGAPRHPRQPHQPPHAL